MITAKAPISTFSVDVDTASYAFIRSALKAGRLPPKVAVRTEEMINYFPYSYPRPEGDAAFHTSVTQTATPWNPNTQLLRIALQGQMPKRDKQPPLNLVFLIDTSGSMHDANKPPLLKQSFRLMLRRLTASDQVAIITYAGSAGQVLAPTAGDQTGAILAALEQLQTGGSTHGQAGLQLAYRTATQMAQAQDITRVILATDRDFNLGISDPEDLKALISKHRDSGIYLSVLGFDRGNLDDATLQALAQNRNGQAAYIDSLSEAQKVLVDQLDGALFPIANDVKIQIEFNPAQVAEYRLIGYETRALRRANFNNDKVDAGDIGAGHQVTALYEITPVGSPARMTEPLRYGAPISQNSQPGIAFVTLRYKRPGETQSQRINAPVGAPESFDADDDLRFAAAIARFGQLLRDPRYMGT
jgi:Ca-activated chloride channel family protein